MSKSWPSHVVIFFCLVGLDDLLGLGASAVIDADIGSWLGLYFMSIWLVEALTILHVRKLV